MKFDKKRSILWLVWTVIFALVSVSYYFAIANRVSDYTGLAILYIFGAYFMAEVVCFVEKEFLPQKQPVK